MLRGLGTDGSPGGLFVPIYTPAWRARVRDLTGRTGRTCPTSR
jgi:hypothetical protein